MSADERTHAALERAARGCVPTATSTLQNGVSVHRFGESVSFSTLRALLLAADADVLKLHAGVVDGGVVVSLNFAHTPAAAHNDAAPARRKRGRDPVEEEADANLRRVRARAEGHGAAIDDAQAAAPPSAESDEPSERVCRVCRVDGGVLVGRVGRPILQRVPKHLALAPERVL